MSGVYDVLIVGAGPAGSFAAELLARQGARVALFDGRPPGEPKACGGGVTAKGLKTYPFLLDAAARTIDEVLMYSPGGRRIKLKLEEPFAIFSRRHLDAHLRERARQKGAEIFSERVTLSSDGAPDKTESIHSSQNDSINLWRVKNRQGSEWRGKVLIAADGANSPVAKRLAGALPNSEMEVAFGYRAPLPANDAPTVIAFLPGYAGYAWAFPRLDHLSFGIATAQSTFQHKELDRILRDFILNYYGAQDLSFQTFNEEREKCNATKDACQVQSNKDERRVRLNKEASEAELKIKAFEGEFRFPVERYAARIPGLSPQVWAARRVVGKNWALLGDAAGFADPVTGEGIYYALRSAELFAQTFAAGEIEKYETAWRADFGRELVRAGEMRARFYGFFLGAPFTDRMIQFALRSRGIRRTLGELIGGEQGYIGLKKKLVKRAIVPFGK